MSKCMNYVHVMFSLRNANMSSFGTDLPKEEVCCISIRLNTRIVIN